MSFARFLQACIPLLLAPLVYWLLDRSGNDKAIAYNIPWVAFGLMYLIVFCLLARFLRSTILLTTASLMLSIPLAIGLTYLTINYLRTHSGYDEYGMPVTVIEVGSRAEDRPSSAEPLSRMFFA